MGKKLTLNRMNLLSLHRLPLTLLFILLMVTISATIYTHYKTVEENQARFDDVKRNIVDSIETRFKFYENALRQTKAYFMQGQKITEDDFRIYVNNIGLINRFPGMTAIGYVEYVPAKDLQKFTDELNELRDNRYSVFPLEEGRDFYTPVKFIEPFFRIIKELVGYDMVNNPERREAMVTSAKDGKATVTEEVDLFITKDDRPMKGFNIFIPVYNGRRDPLTEEKRIENTKGYVFGIFSAQHLFNIILKENELFQKKAAFRLFLENNETASKVFDTDMLFRPDESQNAFSEEIKIEVANKEWTLEIRSLKALENEFSNRLRWYVLLLGIILSFGIYFITRKILSNNKNLKANEHELKKVAHSNSLLIEANRTLGTSLETQVLLKRLADFLVQNFSDCCLIHVQDSDDDEKLHPIIFSSHIAREDLCQETLTEFSSTNHVVNYVYHENKPQSGLIKSSPTPKTYVSLPLMVRNEPFGVVSLLSNDNNIKGEEEIELMWQAVKAASSSIENAILYKEAQISSRLKDEFLATVSHELRTPLMIILGYSKILLKKENDSSTLKALNSIYQAAQNQSSLIEDLLDVSAIVSGKVKFKPNSVELDEVIRSSMENSSLIAKSKGITLVYNDHESCIVLGEKIRLQQILWNLLSNSIKFTPEGGKVEVRLKNLGNKCQLVVSDNGKGMDEDFLPHVFDKFRQEEKTSTRAKGGLGLGLSIVASLVELHGGEIEAKSEGKNKGSSFIITLPLVSAQNIIKINEIDQSQEHDLEGIKILLLDDDEEALNLLSRILEGYNAKVFSANNGRSALSLLDKESFDIVISDIALPEFDGHDFLREVRKKEMTTHKHLSVIALTAFTQEAEKKKIQKSGFDYYLSKPIDPDHLVEILHKFLPTKST